MHILNHRRQSGSIQDTMDLITTHKRNVHELLGIILYTNYQQQNLLTEEQKLNELNPLCDI